MANHRWDKPGRWNGSKDVKRCKKCGIVASKTGLYSGYEWRRPTGPTKWTPRLPPCEERAISETKPLWQDG